MACLTAGLVLSGACASTPAAPPPPVEQADITPAAPSSAAAPEPESSADARAPEPPAAKGCSASKDCPEGQQCRGPEG